MIALSTGKWNNLFLMDIRLSYGLPGSVSVCKVLGEFMNSGKRCDCVKSVLC